MRQAVILAGGKGSRLSPHTGIPKPLTPFGSSTVLDRQFGQLCRFGFEEVLLLIQHEAQKFRDHLREHSYPLKIRIFEEKEPRGTAGALYDQLEHLDSEFLVLYADTVFEIDLKRFIQWHQKKGADITLFSHPNDHPYDSDLLELGSDGRVLAIHPSPREACNLRNQVNAALALFQKQALQAHRPGNKKTDLVKDLFPKLLQDKCKIMGYCSPEYIKDMGTPGRLTQVKEDLQSGLIDRRSFQKPAPAVFLDRDGTLNVEKSHIHNPDHIELLPRVGTAVKRINRSGYRAVVITNQSVIARGQCTPAKLEQVHGKMEQLLGQERAFLDQIYYCPHHPQSGFDGEVKSLKIQCSCRKPNPGMIYQAQKDLFLDLDESWFIGDTTRDLLAAKNAGVRSVLVRTGYGGNDGIHPVRPDFMFYDLKEATDFILDSYEELASEVQKIAKEVQKKSTLLVGGLSQSGKSTLSSTLAHLLKKKGNSAHVISLDGWLRPHPARRPGVRGRFDLAGLKNELKKLRHRNDEITLSIPHYNRKTRNPLEIREKVQVSPNDIVILEGVIALDLDFLREIAQMKLFTSLEESKRKTKLRKEYELRGMNLNQFQTLYRERSEDETPVVLASKAHADFISGEST